MISVSCDGPAKISRHTCAFVSSDSVKVDTTSSCRPAHSMSAPHPSCNTSCTMCSRPASSPSPRLTLCARES